MSDKAPIIQPHCPRDGREWDCQCARCGSGTYWRECEECEDGYVWDDWGDDVIPDRILRKCEWCQGHSGDLWCLSSKEWCEANPLEGREAVDRGQIEWLVAEKLT